MKHIYSKVCKLKNNILFITLIWVVAFFPTQFEYILGRNLYYNFRGHAINQNLEPLKIVRWQDYSQVAYAHFVGDDERQGRSEGGGDAAAASGSPSALPPVECTQVRAGEMDRFVCRGGGDADVTMPKTASMIALHGDNCRDGGWPAAQLAPARLVPQLVGARRPSPLLVRSQSLPNGSLQQLISAWWDHTRLVFDGIDDQLLLLLLLCRSAVLSFVSS